MSIARNQKDIFQMFYGEIPEKIKKSLPRPLKPHVEIEDEFYISTNNNNNKWLHIWKMVVSEKTPTIKIFLRLQEQQKKKFYRYNKKRTKRVKKYKSKSRHEN